MKNKQLYVIGGGTFSDVRTHLALSAPAFGTTARAIADLAKVQFPNMDVNLILTKMADHKSDLKNNADVQYFIDHIIADYDTKVIFFNAALCDYRGSIDGLSGREAGRLKTSEGSQTMILTPMSKIINTIRKKRKDIFLVAFKTTDGATEQEQYLAGLNLLKKNSCNLVLANDTKTRVNMIITPEEAKYCITTSRDLVLNELVEMTYHRSHLSFTKSTVVAGEPIPWSSPLVFSSLRKIVDYCIAQGAYKPFNGATVGHFACKIGEKEFLTSIRKSNFNDLLTKGLVRVTTDGSDTVTAYGAKPSVGGQSQRIIFSEHAELEYDCIVHFHCPLKEKPLNDIPVVSQREYECGSHECGQNTSNGLKRFEEYGIGLSAVMLDNHGPNIVFNHNIDPDMVIRFINNNFDLSDKTGGLVEIGNGMSYA